MKIALIAHDKKKTEMISDNDFRPQNPIRGQKAVQKEPIACHLRPAASPETGSLS